VPTLEFSCEKTVLYPNGKDNSRGISGGVAAMIYDKLVLSYLDTQKWPEAENSRVGTILCGLQSLIVKIEK
jgi:hypothetical protein